MHQIHDKGYKKLFRNKGIFRQLLQTFVPMSWVKDLDFATCECIDKTFISDEYKETASDVIHKIKLKNSEIFIVILTEFKSTVERFTGLSISSYIHDFYRDYLAANSGVRFLPPIFPVLLYNGNAKWSAPTELAELIQNPELLGEHAPRFKYFKIAINEYAREDLLKIGNVVSTLFLAEAHYDAEMLERVFLEIFDREEDKGPISLLLNWLAQLSKHERIPEEDFEKLERTFQSKAEVQEMLITALKREKQEYYNRGKTEGKVEGKIEGKFENKHEVAIKMLTKGFEIELISELTGLADQEILRLKDELKNGNGSVSDVDHGA